jgi:uncharacterized cupin superfamily protein
MEDRRMPIHPARPLKRAANAMDLPPMPYAPEQIIGGNPLASGEVLWQPDDASISRTGIWECTPGVAEYRQEAAEVSAFAFFSGAAVITPEGHGPIEVGPGDVIFLPEATRSIWDVRETIRTFFCVYA